MVFWFFKKRENREDSKILHSKIENIDKKFHISFQNVKKDMTNLGMWIKGIHQKHTDHNNKLN